MFFLNIDLILSQIILVLKLLDFGNTVAKYEHIMIHSLVLTIVSGLKCLPQVSHNVPLPLGDQNKIL